MHWKNIVVVVVLTMVIVVLASFKLYYIRDDAGVDILWNKSEGYLFLSVVRRGYSFSYLEYPIVATRQYFGDVRLPDDRHSSITVLVVTVAAVQRYVADDISLDFYTPLDDAIYANREGALWKWTGIRFEPASPEEERRFDGTNRLSAQAFADVYGWSSLPRVTSGPPEVKVAMGADGQALTLLVRRGDNERDISIDLLRSGYPPQRIWALDERPRRVSEREYRRSVGKR